MIDQTIWIAADATRYEGTCECCVGGEQDQVGVRALLAARVEGEIRRDVDVRWTSCGRGHRIRVRRIVNVGKHERRRLRAA